MALQHLATAADLADLGVDTSDVPLTETALAAATASVRDAAGVPISQATSTVTIQGTRSQWLDLPLSPVVEVTSVAIDGDPVDDYKVVGGSLWRRAYWSACGEPSLVTVTAMHGYLEVPADIKLLVAQLAAAVINADGIESHLGKQSESIDDYSVTYVTGSGSTAYVVELPARTRLMLRQRFGGGAAVTQERE